MKTLMLMYAICFAWIGIGIVVLYKYSKRHEVEAGFQAITIILIWPIILLTLIFRK